MNETEWITMAQARNEEVDVSLVVKMTQNAHFLPRKENQPTMVRSTAVIIQFQPTPHGICILRKCSHNDIFADYVRPQDSHLLQTDWFALLLEKGSRIYSS